MPALGRIIGSPEGPNCEIESAVFRDNSGRGILGIDSIRALLGAILFPEWTEHQYLCSALIAEWMEWVEYGLPGIGKICILLKNFGQEIQCGCQCTGRMASDPVERCSSSQVTSPMSILFSEFMSVLLEIEMPWILLFLNQNRKSQNSSKKNAP